MQHITIKLKKAIKKYYKTLHNKLIEMDDAQDIYYSDLLRKMEGIDQTQVDLNKELLARIEIVQSALDNYVIKQPSNNNQTLQAILHKLNEFEKRLPLDRSNDPRFNKCIFKSYEDWAGVLRQLNHLSVSCDNPIFVLRQDIECILKDRKL